MSWPASRWTRPDSRGGRWAMQNGAWRGRAADAAWTPRQLGSSLLGWWDAEDASTITLSGATVTSWRDKVAGYDAAQGGSSALRPIYGASSFNGRPGITFDGIDDELTLASVPFPTGANGCEIWALVDQTALAADTATRTAFAYGGLTATTRRVDRQVSVGVNRGAMVVGDGALGTTALNGSVDLSGRHVIRGVVTSTNERPDVDGVAGTTESIVPATGSNRVRIGATSATTASGFWQGQVAAALVTSALSATQASQLLTYLKARGGIA